MNYLGLLSPLVALIAYLASASHPYAMTFTIIGMFIALGLEIDKSHRANTPLPPPDPFDAAAR